MMTENSERFNLAASFVCTGIRRFLLNIAPNMKAATQEICLRCGSPLMIFGLYGGAFVFDSGRTGTIDGSGAVIVSRNDIADTFRLASNYSVHSHQNSIKNGYITLQGGHRLGLCGTAVCENSRVASVRDISTLNIRISREFKGCAESLTEAALNGCKGMLIAGSPSSGKTTILRDLTRLLANGGRRVSLIDERDEIAAVHNGCAQNDVGSSCDIFSSYPKDVAILTALRTMSPDYIILDEVGSTQEIEAIENGLNSGVRFIASVHANEERDLALRPQIKRLLATGSFDKIVLLEGRTAPCTVRKIYTTGENI